MSTILPGEYTKRPLVVPSHGTVRVTVQVTGPSRVSLYDFGHLANFEEGKPCLPLIQSYHRGNDHVLERSGLSPGKLVHLVVENRSPEIIQDRCLEGDLS
jgi:hypothetical protein